MTPRFRLRFPLEEVSYWADRYQYADDAEVEEIGKQAGLAGRYTLADLLAIASWKTRGRSRRYVEMNTDGEVRDATILALATSDERERVAALVHLHGVQLPTASVLLHLALADLFPIIDYRALWSLGIDVAPSSYTFGFWWAYVEECRSLAAQARVAMRRLDRALWQYSKERQPAGRSSASRSFALRQTHGGAGKSGAGSEEAMNEAFSTAAYTRLVATAIEGRLIPYSDVAPRRVVGTYLYRIAEYERAHRRPPLTAIVVHKQGGRPGEGFRIAMEQVGYAKPGESDEALWARACADVFCYWRP